MNWKKPITLIVVVLLCLFAIPLCFGIFENLPADKIMVIQDIGGGLHVHTSPGPKWQWWGKVTKYYKLDTYEFSTKVRFNEGGHGTMEGSINFEMPFDRDNVLNLHTKFGSQIAIQKDLVEVSVQKCVYMTGPLMSSKESYSEKRTSLIRYIEDQITNGVYRTTQKEEKTTDPVTGAEKTVTVVEISIDSTGMPLRQEQAVLGSYGIKTSNFAVTALPYDETVEAQIKQQQEINMKVQTAIAAAKEAEQNAITVAKQGEAAAAKSKWEQEVIKAQKVTEAEQTRDVAKLEKEAAEFQKQKLILEGEGQAAKKRLVMAADGALTQKLDAYKEVNSMWADAFSKYTGNIVPSINMADGNSSAGNGFTAAMQAVGLKAMKDLSLDLDTKKQ